MASQPSVRFCLFVPCLVENWYDVIPLYKFNEHSFLPSDTTAGQNCKGLLQELLQKNKCPPPEYREIGKTGDPHEPVYTIRLTAVWQGRELKVEKSARKKLDAEKEAAKEMHEMITNPPVSYSITNVQLIHGHNIHHCCLHLGS